MGLLWARLCPWHGAVPSIGRETRQGRLWSNTTWQGEWKASGQALAEPKVRYGILRATWNPKPFAKLDKPGPVSPAVTGALQIKCHQKPVSGMGVVILVTLHLLSFHLTYDYVNYFTQTPSRWLQGWPAPAGLGLNAESDPWAEGTKVPLLPLWCPHPVSL